MFFLYINKTEYDNMRVVDLKALMKECGLGGYSKLSKADLIELL